MDNHLFQMDGCVKNTICIYFASLKKKLVLKKPNQQIYISTYNQPLTFEGKFTFEIN